MSARSRAAPWFLDRPPELQRRMLVITSAAKSYAEFSAQFSFDGVTWFDERGCCWYQGSDADYGYPTLRWMAEKYRDWGHA